MIETEKVTLEVVAEESGVLKILIQEGETVAIGAVVGQIETAGVAAAPPAPEAAPKVEPEKVEAPKTPAPAEPAVAEPSPTPPVEPSPQKPAPVVVVA